MFASPVPQVVTHSGSNCLIWPDRDSNSRRLDRGSNVLTFTPSRYLVRGFIRRKRHVGLSYLAYALAGRLRQVVAVHLCVHVLVELLVAVLEEVVGEAVLDDAVLDVRVLGQFDGRVDARRRRRLLHQHDRVERHQVLGEVDHSSAVGRVGDRRRDQVRFLNTIHHETVSVSTLMPTLDLEEEDSA